MSDTDGYLCNEHRRAEHPLAADENCVACAYEQGWLECARAALLRRGWGEETFVAWLKEAGEVEK